MMKLPIKLILLVAGVVLAANLFTSDQAARDYTYTSASAAGAPPSAETLFKQKCTKCHGADGSGDTSMGRIFNAPDFTDANWWAKHSNRSELVNAISRGKKNMPAFGKKLTRAQISSLASYVQHFKR